MTSTTAKNEVRINVQHDMFASESQVVSYSVKDYMKILGKKIIFEQFKGVDYLRLVFDIDVDDKYATDCPDWTPGKILDNLNELAKSLGTFFYIIGYGNKAHCLEDGFAWEDDGECGAVRGLEKNSLYYIEFKDSKKLFSLHVTADLKISQETFIGLKQIRKFEETIIDHAIYSNGRKFRSPFSDKNPEEPNGHKVSIKGFREKFSDVSLVRFIVQHTEGLKEITLEELLPHFELSVTQRTVARGEAPRDYSIFDFNTVKGNRIDFKSTNEILLSLAFVEGSCLSEEDFWIESDIIHSRFPHSNYLERDRKLATEPDVQNLTPLYAIKSRIKDAYIEMIHELYDLQDDFKKARRSAKDAIRVQINALKSRPEYIRYEEYQALIDSYINKYSRIAFIKGTYSYQDFTDRGGKSDTMNLQKFLCIINGKHHVRWQTRQIKNQEEQNLPTFEEHPLSQIADVLSIRTEELKDFLRFQNIQTFSSMKYLQNLIRYEEPDFEKLFRFLDILRMTFTGDDFDHYLQSEAMKYQTGKLRRLNFGFFGENNTLKSAAESLMCSLYDDIAPGFAIKDLLTDFNGHILKCERGYLDELPQSQKDIGKLQSIIKTITQNDSLFVNLKGVASVEIENKFNYNICTNYNNFSGLFEGDETNQAAMWKRFCLIRRSPIPRELAEEAGGLSSDRSVRSAFKIYMENLDYSDYLTFYKTRKVSDFELAVMSESGYSKNIEIANPEIIRKCLSECEIKGEKHYVIDDKKIYSLYRKNCQQERSKYLDQSEFILLHIKKVSEWRNAVFYGYNENKRCRRYFLHSDKLESFIDSLAFKTERDEMLIETELETEF